ncbi:MAG TPA: HWE histidine kinase domain-containing protein [Xanthobacteraceae bacterium]|nr:HWE histidine kinase domain-containing protein [Xanthobacteraceae bacterium]
MDKLIDWFREAVNYAPPDNRLSWQQDLVALHAVSDAIIAVSYLAIAAGILWVLLHRLHISRGQRALGWLLCVFMLICAAIHSAEVLSLWQPMYGVQGMVKASGALASVVTIAFMFPLLPDIVKLPSAQQVIDANERLRREVAAHGETARAANAMRLDFENRIGELTRGLNLIRSRFEAALRGADIYVFSQDAELRYTWVFSPRSTESATKMLGKTDDDILASPEHDTTVAAKRRVLKTGIPEECEVTYTMPEGRAVYMIRIFPTYGADRTISGIMCAAINISRLHSLVTEQRLRSEKLETTLQRYDTALRGSNVTVYTQDLGLRYVSVSSPMFGLDTHQIIGRTDEDILPPQSRASTIAIKKEALETGRPKDCEICIQDGTTERWYDVHMEPLREVTGASVGLICASVDITARKEGEVHLRLLMRELTHRSKNLLAVIQAMARQTARRAESIEQFTEQFAARLQALATSHDLLIQESWHGALLADLVRSQLGHYLDRENSQISVEGPGVFLKPEAAQNIGLALHELATNAAKYGALSVPSGHVSITWRWVSETNPKAVEIVWLERGGPKVSPPEQRGFGSVVIERNLAKTLEADVHLAFESEGIECRIVIPTNLLVVGR